MADGATVKKTPKTSKTPQKKPKKRGPKPKYQSAAKLQEKVSEYLKSTGPQIVTLPNGEIARDGKGNAVWREVVPTIAGLALALGYIDRDAIADTIARGKAKGADSAARQMSRILTRARLEIQGYWESKLVVPGAANGVKLWLTNHAEYKDRQELDLNAKLPPTINVTLQGGGA